MTTAQLLKKQDFEQVSEVRPDGKHRVSLGKIEASPAATAYKVYVNSAGQIILDPQVSVPASEAWIFKNKAVSQALEKGLDDAKAGRVRKAREDYSKYVSDED